MSFGIFWYFLTLVVESSILNLELIFEHRLYIPSVGFWPVMIYLIMHLFQFVMAMFFPSVTTKNSPSVTTRYFSLVMAKSEATKQSHHKKDLILISIFILVLTGQGYGTILRNQVWQDDLTLWEDAVQKSPNKARPHNNIGLAYYEKGWDDKAVKKFEIAIEMEPDYAKAYNNLGVVYYDQGLYDQAITAYKQALNIKSNYASAYYNLGIIYYDQGLYDQAMIEYKQALQIKPDDKNTHYYLALIYKNKNQNDKAIFHIKECLKYETDERRKKEEMDMLQQLMSY